MPNVNIKGWAMIPGLLLDDFVEKKVSSEALSLYAIIRLQWGGFASVFPKQSTIAEVTGFSLAKVKRLLKELNDAGWILSERQHKVHGYNEYYICDEPFVKPEVTKMSKKLRKLTTDVEEG